MRINEFIKINKENTITSPCSYNDIATKFNEVDTDFIAIIDSFEELIGTIYRNKFKLIDPDEFALDDVLSKRFIYDYFHILETIREFLKCEKEQLPIIDEEGYYIGVCYLQDVQYHFNRTLGLIEGGSLITIRTTTQNYSLVDVARIAESNQAKILTHYVSTHPDSDYIEATVVLNITDISDIVATYERFDYMVTYSSIRTERDDFLKTRYDSLMHYLDI